MAIRLLPPNPLLFSLEWPRAMAEAATLPLATPVLSQAPRGDGHPVLVLPGFTADDGSTRVLREFLFRLGYSVHRWTLGRNMGLDHSSSSRLQQRLAEIFKRKNRKVSLVGWSLGGIYARELAKNQPEAVRQVVTLGSPFGGAQRGDRVGWLHRMVTGEELTDAETGWYNRLLPPPPVPSTAIYSKTDGIAAWRACREEGEGQVDNVEVPGSHCGLGFNALVYWALADRLAQAENAWRPFDRRGLRRLFYR